MNLAGPRRASKILIRHRSIKRGFAGNCDSERSLRTATDCLVEQGNHAHRVGDPPVQDHPPDVRPVESADLESSCQQLTLQAEELRKEKTRLEEQKAALDAEWEIARTRTSHLAGVQTAYGRLNRKRPSGLHDSLASYIRCRRKRRPQPALKCHSKAYQSSAF